MRCSWPISPSEPTERVGGRHHTRPLHAHAACESAPPPKTIRACLAGALLPGVEISRHLLAAARRYRPKAQQLHRTRATPQVFSRKSPLLKHPGRSGEKQSHTAAPSLETRIPEANPRSGIRGGAASAAAAAPAGSLLPPNQHLAGGSGASHPPASPPAHHSVVLFRVRKGFELVCPKKKLVTETLVINL